MEETRDTLAGEVMRSFIVLLRVLQKRSASHWIDLDLSLAQVKTLLIIGDLEASSIEQIANMLGVSQPTTSHLVERLVQNKLADRVQDTHNRRRVVVQLTRAGEELLQHLLGSGTLNELSVHLGDLSEEELAVFARGIRLIINNLTNDPALLAFTPGFTERASRSEQAPQEQPPEDNV